MNMTDVFGLTTFERHADGDCDVRLIRNCNLIMEGGRRLALAVRDGNDDLEAKILVYLRRHIEIAIGTPAETIVGMAAKGVILRNTDDHKELLAESLANDALRIYSEGYGKRFDPMRVEREMRDRY
jgi:hypothetical protein